MSTTQSVNQPAWKVHVWFPKVAAHLEKMIDELEQIIGGKHPCSYLFPHLSQHWEDINRKTFEGVELLEGWLIIEETRVENEPRKKVTKTFTWDARYITFVFLLILKLQQWNLHKVQQRIQRCCKIFGGDH